MMFKAKQNGDEAFDSPYSLWLSGPSPHTGMGILQKFPKVIHFEKPHASLTPTHTHCDPPQKFPVGH